MKRFEPLIPPGELTPEDVDVDIWPTVQDINKSGWIWTTESCSGHGQDRALLGLVTNDPGRAFRALGVSLMCHSRERSRFDPNTPKMEISFFSPSKMPDLGSFHFRVIIYGGEALDVLSAFSGMIYE